MEVSGGHPGDTALGLRWSLGSTLRDSLSTQKLPGVRWLRWSRVEVWEELLGRAREQWPQAEPEQRPWVGVSSPSWAGYESKGAKGGERRASLGVVAAGLEAPGAPSVL